MRSSGCHSQAVHKALTMAPMLPCECSPHMSSLMPICMGCPPQPKHEVRMQMFMHLHFQPSMSGPCLGECPYTDPLSMCEIL